MEHAINGLKFTPVTSDTFVVLPSLDLQARLPLNDKLVLGSLFSGGVVVMQLCYYPASFTESNDFSRDASLEAGTPEQRQAHIASGSTATLRWVSTPVDGRPISGVGSIRRLPELRMDDQIGDLVRSRAHKAAIRELRKMHARSSGASLWSRLRQGSGRDRVLVIGSLLAKFGLAATLAYSVLFLWAKTADLDARLYNLRLSQSAPAGVSPGTPGALAQSDRLAPDQLMVLLDLVRKSGISRFPDGDSFVMFSDPNCPACRAFEAKMAAENWPFTPLVIPVAFQEGSREAVAGVLCASNLGKAWEQAVAGKPPAACEKGTSQATQNNDAFAALQLDSTPTFVSMSGSVFRGASDMQSLMDWARSNAPGGKIGLR